MIPIAKIYLLVFGLLTIVGGVIGYVRAGSMASIIAGSVSGVLLLVAGYLLAVNLPAGLILGLVVSILLAGRFLPIFIQKGTMMPAGMMSILSVIGIVLTALAWWKK